MANDLIVTGGRSYSFRKRTRTRGGVFVVQTNFEPVAEAIDTAQKRLDDVVLNDMCRYIPMQDGHLIQQTRKINERSAGEHGRGFVWVYPPALEYAHYQYEGKKYVDPVYRKGGFYAEGYGWWSRPGVRKVNSGEPLVYGSKNPLAHAHWDAWAIVNHYSQWYDVVKNTIEEEMAKHDNT